MKCLLLKKTQLHICQQTLAKSLSVQTLLEKSRFCKSWLLVRTLDRRLTSSVLHQVMQLLGILQKLHPPGALTLDPAAHCFWCPAVHTLCRHFEKNFSDPTFTYTLTHIRFLLKAHVCQSFVMCSCLPFIVSCKRERNSATSIQGVGNVHNLHTLRVPQKLHIQLDLLLNRRGQHLLNLPQLDEELSLIRQHLLCERHQPLYIPVHPFIALHVLTHTHLGRLWLQESVWLCRSCVCWLRKSVRKAKTASLLPQ